MVSYFMCGVFILTTVLLLNLATAVRWEASLGWCRSTTNDYLYQGDFNGDGRLDLLCHRSTNGYKWIAFANANGQFTGTSWQKSLNWCHGNGAEIHVGDFNGDGRDDMLCHSSISGKKWIAHANIAGNFDSSTTWTRDLGWCKHNGAELHIGDFNGDTRDDMLCHDKNTGRKWIAYANCAGNFDAGTGWEAGLGWCLHSGAQLFIGDFNGDTRDDMLCHDGTGYKWIAYANPAGNFAGGTGWQEGLGWCRHSGAELFIGDANGDGKDDIFCHDTGTGHKWVALSNSQSNFHDRTSWEAGLGWCRHASAQFFLGDYNRDYKTDMLCHDTSNGKKWIIYSIPFYQ